jgi:two-component system chemotaxis response regulator CheB
MRTALTRLLSSDPQIQVLGTARDGQDGLDKVHQLRPDVVTLDIEMPVLDGISVLKKLPGHCASVKMPTPAVLMCSSLTKEGSHEALLAMRLGAADVIAKAGSQFSLHMDAMRDELVAKVKAIGQTHASRHFAAAPAPAPIKAGTITRFRPRQFDLVCIGSSTGGPPVLETILTGLPADLPCPIVISQHMPPIFTKSLAERLDHESALTVAHGEPGMRLIPGTAYIAPGGLHTRVQRSGTGLVLEISEEPRAAIYRPSVNELFASAAAVLGSKACGVVCTGMGDDGMIGAKAIKARGGTMVTQAGSTCVVYGMPKAVDTAGASDTSLAPDQIAKLIATLSPSVGALAA